MIGPSVDDCAAARATVSSTDPNIPDTDDLPPLYEPVRLGSVDSAAAHAARMAREGAGEGTLVIAESQEDDRTASGGHWMSPAGNLHCAMIIEPEYSHEECMQLAFVAMTSMGGALSKLLTPMTSVGYRLPGQLLLNGLRAGRLQISAGRRGGVLDTLDNLPGVPYNWLVLAWAVNVGWHPPNPEPERYASVQATGAVDVTPESLLQGYARHFLSAINRWAEHGFGATGRAWQRNAEGIGEAFTLGANGTASDEVGSAGIFTGLDERGRILLASEDAGRDDAEVAAIDAGRALDASIDD